MGLGLTVPTCDPPPRRLWPCSPQHPALPSPPPPSPSTHNVPTILLEAYLIPILKYCPTTNKIFLILLLSDNAVSCSFIIASFNIHRLTIAGITVTSKFFSDVFYTISRYVKVGGLPLAELNQLKLQFLLNNFCLIISSAEMQRYAKQLVLFSSSADPQTQQNLHAHPPPSMTRTHTKSTSTSTSATG
ncbi:hypothetical protein H0H87_008902 [Tephrocybe sp. NHM501043]|nr:hypothetical protein H0H87_008902 [Tephrocybe sp. NHM501043]